jgi:hypothetical protein
MLNLVLAGLLLAGQTGRWDACAGLLGGEIEVCGASAAQAAELAGQAERLGIQVKLSASGKVWRLAVSGASQGAVDSALAELARQVRQAGLEGRKVIQTGGESWAAISAPAAVPNLQLQKLSGPEAAAALPPAQGAAAGEVLVEPVPVKPLSNLQSLAYGADCALRGPPVC